MQLQVKMPQKCRSNVFRSRQKPNKAPSNIFRGVEVGTSVRFIFTRPKHNTKGLWNISAVKNKQLGALRVFRV